MKKHHGLGLSLAGLSLLCATHAEAHFRLVEPPSWLAEDELGGPQKGSPCGPGNSMLIIGDDVQPVPLSNTVTTFSAGQSVLFKLDETIYHPGYFRISFARKKAVNATTADFPNPPLTDTVNCHYDNAAVPTGPHDNVLADGLFVAAGDEGTGRSLQHSIKLPDEPCDECSLQVVQVMEGHPGSSCFYFHCADIKIVKGPVVDAGTKADAGALADAGTKADAGSTVSLPDASNKPGAGGLRDAGNTSGVSGTADAGRTGAASDAAVVGVRSDAGAPAARGDSGGCAVGPATRKGYFDSAWFVVLVAIAALARRPAVRILRGDR